MSRLHIQDRPYQTDLTNYGTDFIFNEAEHTAGLLCAPTGTGKSIIIARIVSTVLQYYPTARILMLTHVKELVEQNYEKAQSLCDVDIGLWHAGLRKKQWDSSVVFAGIDTVRNSPENLGRRDVVIIDEAHRVAPNPLMTYRNVAEYLREKNNHMKYIGLTATPYRMGQGHLTEPWYKPNKEEVPPFWQKTIRDYTSPKEFLTFFEEGYLKRLVPKPTDESIDVSGMRQRSGDYAKEDVEAAANNEEKIRAIVSEICDNGYDRRSWLVFAAGNRNAELLTQEMKKRGVSVAVVTDDTSKAEREDIIARYKNYEIRCLINNEIFTTGFDHAGVDLIAVVRATMSTPLWVQMLGRGTRPVYASGFDLSTKDGRLQAIFASGVYNCLVLDFARNSERLGKINDPVIPEPPTKRKKKAGSAPVRICPRDSGGCGAYNAVTAQFCEYCNFEFPMSEKIEHEAGTRELISEKEHVPDIRRLVVSSVNYRIREGRFGNGVGSSTTIEAVYNCGRGNTFKETLTFGKNATVKTRNWWEMFGNGYAMPTSNEEFIKIYSNSSYLKQLECIDVYMNKPKRTRPEVDYYGFKDTGHTVSST